jgi:hypothetical protein
MSSHSFEVARFSAMQVVTELEISHRMEKSLLSQRELIYLMGCNSWPPKSVHLFWWQCKKSRKRISFLPIKIDCKRLNPLHANHWTSLWLDIGVEFLLNCSGSIDFSKISPLWRPRFLVATTNALSSSSTFGKTTIIEGTVFQFRATKANIWNYPPAGLSVLRSR